MASRLPAVASAQAVTRVEDRNRRPGQQQCRCETVECRAPAADDRSEFGRAHIAGRAEPYAGECEQIAGNPGWRQDGVIPPGEGEQQNGARHCDRRADPPAGARPDAVRECDRQARRYRQQRHDEGGMTGVGESDALAQDGGPDCEDAPAGQDEEAAVAGRLREGEPEGECDGESEDAGEHGAQGGRRDGIEACDGHPIGDHRARPENQRDERRGERARRQPTGGGAGFRRPR